MKFAYLLQHPRLLMPRWRDAIDPNTQIVLLTFASPAELLPPGVRTIFEPHTTWTQGRNLLREYVLRLEEEQGWRFDYWIFADGDVALYHDGSKMGALGQLPDNPFRAFETLLERWEPAVAWPCMYPPARARPVETCENFDACFNAIRREVAQVLLPYVEDFDNESWYYSQWFFWNLCLLLLPGYCIGFNVLQTRNDDHASYPRAMNYHKTAAWLQANVNPPIRIFGHNEHESLIQPRMKDRDYAQLLISCRDKFIPRSRFYRRIQALIGAAHESVLPPPAAALEPQGQSTPSQQGPQS